VVLGLPSSGLHTNGYSLVRRIVHDRELDYTAVLTGTDEPLADLLLRPHRSYLAAVRELRAALEVRALAHITGGGLKENVPRVLPAGLGVELERGSWPVPDIFGAIEKVGGVHPDEMWRTFNMGIGMVVIVPAEQAEAVTSAAGLDVLRIGRVVAPSTSERVVLR
jgi:phosphoribosylformylglycinamidine cyclo-ligase